MINNTLPLLNFPEYHFTIRENAGKPEIFDGIRGKYVALTPEEWVRQNLIQYLINQKHIPDQLIAIEKGLKVNRLEKRFDLMVFGRDGNPRMLLECKAPNVVLKQEVFDQVARYNLAFKVNYLFVTNGLKHFCCHVDFASREYRLLKEVPDFNELN